MRTKRTSHQPDLFTRGFLRSIALRRDLVESFDEYPFSLPAVRSLRTLAFDPNVTFFVGENGSGKSTLLEAIAVAAGFNAEGGTKNFNFATASTHSELHDVLQLVRGARREKDGFFLRAESFYNVATQIDFLEEDEGGGGLLGSYGSKSLHEQSHGESFMALATNRFRGNRLYILDEPEAALSPSRQLALLQVIDRQVRKMNSQFIIATHSPIILAYPRATIYHLDAAGIAPIAYEETEHFKVTLDFLRQPDVYFHHLFDE